MASLFVSYSRKDIETAKKLTEHFKDQGLDFWIDWEDIPATVDWWREVEKGIEETDVFVFLISPDSLKSDVCKQEVVHATKNGKRLIPIVVRDIHASESPAELRQLNWIFIREQDDFAAGCSKLINAIQTDFKWVQAHRQVQVKALEWERNNHENSYLLRGKELEEAEFELATNSSKEPRPTDLQHKYVLKSRQVTDRQRRTVTVVALIGLILLAALAVFGFLQAGLARMAEATAISNQSTAEAASTLAFENAVEAEKQSQIARLRELSAQAQLNADQSPSRALLLAVEAARISQHLNMSIIASARQALQDALSKTDGMPLPGGQITIDSVEFAPDGKWFLTHSELDVVQVWNAFQLEKAPVTVENARRREFALGGRILTGSDTSLEIWDLSGDTPQRLLHLTFDQEYLSESATEEIILLDKDGFSRDYAMSPDGRWFVIFNVNDFFTLIDLNSPQQTSMAFSAPYDVAQTDSFRFSPQSNWLVVRSAGGPYLYRLELDNAGALLTIRQDTGVGGFSSLEFSKDERWAVSYGQTSTELWSINNEEFSRQARLGEAFSPFAFSPDNTNLVVRDKDKLYLWNLPEQIPESGLGNPLVGPSASQFAFSSDSRQILSSGQEGVYLWDVISGQVSGPKTITSKILQISFLPDASGLIVLAEDGQVIYYPQSLQEEQSLTLLEDPLTETEGGPIINVNIRFSPDGRFVAILDGNSKLHLLDLNMPGVATAERFVTDQTFSAHSFSNDSRWLIAGSATDVVPRLWDLQNLDTQLVENTTRVFPGGADPDLVGTTGTYRPSPGPSFVISSDGRWLANTVSSNGQLFDLSAKTKSPTLLGAKVTNLTLSPDNRWLAANFPFSPTIEIWDLESARPSQSVTLGLPTRSQVIQIQYSLNGKWLVAKTHFQVFIIDWERQRFDQPSVVGFEPPRMGGGGGGYDQEFRPGDNLAISADGKWLAFGFNYSGGDRGIHFGTSKMVWKLSSLAETPLRLSGPFSSDPSTTTSMRFSNDGRWMASIPTGSGIAVLWDMSTSNPNSTFKQLVGNRRLVSALAFSPDNHWLATGHGNDIYLWDLTSKDPSVAPRILKGHTKTVWSLAFSQDGQTLASGSRDGTIRLWDMKARIIITSSVLLSGHTAEVYDIAFARNGAMLASNSLDGTTRVWSLDFNQMMTLACKKAGRNLTQEEWSLYFEQEAFREICPEWQITSSNLTPMPTSENVVAPVTPIAQIKNTATPEPIPIPTNTLMNQLLTPTALGSFIEYKVQEGDTLSGIARTFNIPMEVIVQDNNLSDPNSIFVGQIMLIRTTTGPTGFSSPTP